MHVLHLLDYQPPFAGGIVDNLASLGETLTARGDRITLAFPSRQAWFAQLTSVGDVLVIPEIRTPMRSRFGSLLERLCAEREVDLVHLHFSFSMPLALALPGSRFRRPVVHHWHNPPKALQSGAHVPGHRALTRLPSTLLARRGDRAITRHVAVSAQTETLLIEHRWTSADKVTLIPNTVNAPPEPARAPAEAPEFVVGSVANFRPQKDHITLLQAFRLLVDSHPSSRLLLVGDGPLRPQLSAQVAELGLTSKVEFLGFVDDVRAVHQQMHVFALSTHFEGHCLSVLEAMASGLPVVATDIPSSREALTSGVEGLLVPPQSPDAFAAALRSLAADRASATVMGDAGRATALREYPISRWVDRLCALYAQILTTVR